MFISLFEHLRRKSSFKILELYPPFFFMGVKIVSVAPDYRSMHAQLPRRWYGSNMHGSIFGGFMLALADPLPALMCGRIFPGTEMWTKGQSVEFRRPAHSKVDLRIQIPDEAVEAISALLARDGKATYTFSFAFTDKHGHVVADVKNTIFLRRPKRGELT